MADRFCTQYPSCAEDKFCGEGIEKLISQECNLIPCETFQMQKGSWSPCSQSCGGGYRTRKMTCFSSYGHAVESGKCTCTGSDCATFEMCNEKACDAPYLTFSAYSPCDVTCGGGFKERVSTCNNPDGTVAATSVCDDLGLTDSLQRVSCNSAPCKADSFVWETGSWSACTPATCGGTRTREVTCKYGPNTPCKEEQTMH